MAIGYSAKPAILQNASVSGVVTNQVVTSPWPVSTNGSIHHVVKIVTAGVTVVGSVVAKLQSAIGSDWVDSKTVTISGNGVFYIKLLAEATGDQTYLPLLNQARVVLTTTNAGDAVIISDIEILQ